MIIECPACNTRYDIKVDLPPEGRSVRCAKCEHVWRAVQIVEEEEDDFSTSEDDAFEEDAGAEEPDYSSYQQTAEASEDEERFSDDPSFALDVAQEEEEDDDNQEAAGEEKGGGWFGSFLRNNQNLQADSMDKGGYHSAPTDAAQEQEPEEEAAPASFSRPAIAAEARSQPESDVHTLNNARAAVRDVFASLGEQRFQQNAAAFQTSLSSYAEAKQEEEDFSFEPTEAGEVEAADWGSGTAREPDYTQETTESPANAHGWMHNWQSQDDRQQASSESDLDAQLRAALQAHFPSHTTPPSPAHPVLTPDMQFPEEEPAESADESEVSEALTAFWKRPAPIRAEAPGTPLPLEEDASAADLSFDEGLFHDIEEVQELGSFDESRRQNGALALAAAWGLFLCVAAGLTSGVFAFREIAVGAVPGLASFYSAVGMPVTTQPLIFEGVQYEWSVSDFKPALHIKGAVYNRAQRGVDVPNFIVSIKDNDPALDKEFPASLPVEGDKLAPEQRTEFEIELVSPSPSITAVVLELRNIH
jgi:predicted Zn finger-like uncharacterized protein